jgi:uncharacterized protein
VRTSYSSFLPKERKSPKEWLAVCVISPNVTAFHKENTMRILNALALTTALALSFAAAAAAEGAATITVTGEGVVQAQPDQATISLGVTTNGETAAKALSDNNAALTMVLERLKAAGVAETDLQTSNLSLSPNWTGYDSGSTPSIAGYIATNMLDVRVRDLAALGTILDAAVTDGANTMNGITFGLADPTPVMNDARTKAVADAKARAEVLATAAGTKLGKLVSVSEMGVYPGPAPMFRQDAASAVPIQSGQIGMTSNVNVTYEIAE